MYVWSNIEITTKNITGKSLFTSCAIIINSPCEARFLPSAPSPGLQKEALDWRFAAVLSADSLTCVRCRSKQYVTGTCGIRAVLARLGSCVWATEKAPSPAAQGGPVIGRQGIHIILGGPVRVSPVDSGQQPAASGQRAVDSAECAERAAK